MIDYNGNTTLAKNLILKFKGHKPPITNLQKVSKISTEISRHEIKSYDKSLKDSLEQTIDEKVTASIEFRLQEIDPSKSVNQDKSAGISNDSDLFTVFANERSLVHAEIENIKTCRTRLFIGILGIIGGASIAILGIIGAKNGLTPLLNWLPFATALPIVFLTPAIATIIYKSRGINERMGYLEAIDDLKKSNSLKMMKGWVSSCSANRRCEILCKGKRSSKEDPKITAKCTVNHNISFCKEKAKNEAKKITQHIGLFPEMLNSFTSLCTYVYISVYCFSVCAFLWSILTLVKSWVSEGKEVGTLWFWVAVIIGGSVTLGVSIFAFYNKPKSCDHPKLRVIWTYSSCAIRVFIIPFAIIGILAILKVNNAIPFVSFLAYFLGGFIAALAIIVAFPLLENLNSLRKGRHSIDRWRYTWKIRFQQCPLMESHIL